MIIRRPRGEVEVQVYSFFNLGARHEWNMVIRRFRGGIVAELYAFFNLGARQGRNMVTLRLRGGVDVLTYLLTYSMEQIPSDLLYTH